MSAEPATGVRRAGPRAAASQPSATALSGARIRFVPGPASATSMPSRRGCRNQREVDRAPAWPSRRRTDRVPNSSGVPAGAARKRATVPTGSTWGSGFNVSRPARAAVGSPARYATDPVRHLVQHDRRQDAARPRSRPRRARPLGSICRRQCTGRAAGRRKEAPAMVTPAQAAGWWRRWTARRRSGATWV